MKKEPSILSIQRSLLRLNSRLGIKNMLKGIDYYRLLEYPVTIQSLQLETKHIVADLGSLDSIFPLYLAAHSSKTFSIDLSEKVKEMEIKANKIGIKSIESVVANATDLSFSNNFFDRVSAVSCLEHFLPIEDGDIKAIHEIQRILKPGGIVVITVPFGKKYEEEWRESFRETEQYLQRRYDLPNLEQRLVHSFGENLDSYSIQFFNSRLGFEKIWYKFLVYLLNPLAFLFSNIFLKIQSSPKNCKGAILILKKRRAE